MCEQKNMDAFLRWIGTFLGWLDGLTNSYMLALFIFAIIVEILLLPLSIKQQKNSIKQAKLRPKEMAIRNKYKGRNDQVTQKKIQEEIQALYSRENFSPFAGCLPMLVQLPIIIILYSVVRQPLEYVVGLSKTTVATISTFIETNFNNVFVANITNNGSIGHISAINEMGIDKFAGMEPTALAELTAAVDKGLPNFTELGLNLGLVPSISSPSLLWLIPVLTFLVYFGSMKLTRKFTYQAPSAQNQQMGCSNNIMDIGMPLFSVFISFQFPAAIGVYWIFKSLVGTAKQFAMYKVMPIPKFTEDDYRQAEKEYAGKSKTEKAVSSLPNGQKPRSLHRIDDEEDEQPKPSTPRKGTRFDYDDEDAVETSKAEKPNEKLLSVERAAIKEDDKDEAKSQHKKKYDKKDKQ